MTDRITFGVHKRPDPVCECKHLRFEHAPKGVHPEQPCLVEVPEGTPGRTVTGYCRCPAFVRKGAIPKSRKRSILKFSRGAERKGGDYVDGCRMPSTGKVDVPDVVVYGSDDGELLVAEVKHRAITKARKDAMRQAMAAARGRRGAPLPCLIEIDKPGPGKQDGMDMISFLASDWKRIKERLSGE